MAIPFKKIQIQDYELSKIQDNTENAFRFLDTQSFLNGNIISATIKTTDTVVNHGLNRKYQGWVIVDQDAASSIYRSSTTNNLPDKQLFLKASVQTNAKVYVF